MSETDPRFSAGLAHFRELEKRAKDTYAAFLSRRTELMASVNGDIAKLSSEQSDELIRLDDAQLAASTRATEARQKLGISGGRPVPASESGMGSGAVADFEAFLAENPNAVTAPTGAAKVSSLIEAALALPFAGGFKSAVDGGNLYAPNRGIKAGIADLPRRRLSVLDLIPVAGTFPDELGGATLEYYRTDTRTNAAATVAALSQKPESTLTISRQSTKMWTYAHISEAVPLQFITRGGGLQQYIEQDMAMSVMEAHESDILSGTGTTEVDGLTHVSGTLTQASTGDPVADVRKALTQLQNANIQPDALVLNPTDAEKIDLQQDGDGAYYWGGPLAAGPLSAWSTPVVISTGLTAGTAILGAFRLGAVRWVGASRLEWGRINTDFQYNQLRLVAEAGASAAITRPGAFVKITIV